MRVKLQGGPAFEHLNKSLLIYEIRLRQTQEIIEELLKPLQLCELATLNSNFRKGSLRPSVSVSPFNSSRVKHAETGRRVLAFLPSTTVSTPHQKFMASKYPAMHLSLASLQKNRLTVHGVDISGLFILFRVLFITFSILFLVCSFVDDNLTKVWNIN